MIPQKKLSLLANRLASNGKRIQEQILERDYCISWFLAGLDNGELKHKLVFKGGTALKKCYFVDYRFSEDLDFTLAGDITFDEVLSGLEPVFQYISKNADIKMAFSRVDKDSHQNSHTFYMSYEGPVPKSKARELKTDITIKENMINPVETRPLLSYKEYSDIPAGINVRVYSLAEIFAEKITALFDRARNEPRDLYDVWYLCANGCADSGEIRSNVERKLEFRNKNFADIKGEFHKKEARLKKLWNERLANQMAQIPQFDEVFRVVKREFRKAALIG